MKTGFVKQGNKTYVNIEFARSYEDNYKIHMLEENDISGLLPVCGVDEGGTSRYRYTVTGMTTMEARFELKEMKKDDVLQFVSCLYKTVEALQKFMLDPSGLVLYPKYLFWDRESWKFCYIPIKKKALNEEFHALMEYFEERADDKDEEGMLFIFRVHRATLEENYDLAKILRECTADMRSAEKEGSEDMIKEYDTNEHILLTDEEGFKDTGQPKAIREAEEPESFWRRKPNKEKKSRWSFKI